jgi:hypothetical protein
MPAKAAIFAIVGSRSIRVSALAIATLTSPNSLAVAMETLISARSFMIVFMSERVSFPSSSRRLTLTSKLSISPPDVPPPPPLFKGRSVRRLDRSTPGRMGVGSTIAVHPCFHKARSKKLSESAIGANQGLHPQPTTVRTQKKQSVYNSFTAIRRRVTTNKCPVIDPAFRTRLLRSLGSQESIVLT